MSRGSPLDPLYFLRSLLVSGRGLGPQQAQKGSLSIRDGLPFLTQSGRPFRLFFFFFLRGRYQLSLDVGFALVQTHLSNGYYVSLPSVPFLSFLEGLLGCPMPNLPYLFNTRLLIYFFLSVGRILAFHLRRALTFSFEVHVSSFPST